MHYFFLLSVTLQISAPTLTPPPPGLVCPRLSPQLLTAGGHHPRLARRYQFFLFDWIIIDRLRSTDQMLDVYLGCFGPVPIVIWFPHFFFIHVRPCLLFACLYAYVHTLTLSCHLHPPVCRSTSPVICSSSASSCQAPWCCSYRRRMCDVLVLMATASRAPPLLSGLLGVLL